MAEVNEEILEQYLKVVKKWFYIGDIPFAVPSNYSNIDVLGYDPLKKRYYDFEVKYRSAYSMTNNGKDIEYLTEQFNEYRNQREAKISEYIGNKETIKTIVTTKTMMGKSEAKRAFMEKDYKDKMQKLGYKCDIWYFDDMIPELIRNVEKKGRYNTQLLQTIRLIKVYGANSE